MLSLSLSLSRSLSFSLSHTYIHSHTHIHTHTHTHTPHLPTDQLPPPHPPTLPFWGGRHCDTMPTTRCNTLQHAATRCNTLHQRRTPHKYVHLPRTQLPKQQNPNGYSPYPIFSADPTPPPRPPFPTLHTYSKYSELERVMTVCVCVFVCVCDLLFEWVSPSLHPWFPPPPPPPPLPFSNPETPPGSQKEQILL